MATELRPDIQSAKDRISTRMGAGREFKKLESYLWEGEVVDSVCVGQYGRGTGLLVLTNSRLLFLVDGMTGSTFEDFPLSKITSVQWSSGFVQGTLTVYASGNKAEINNVAKPDGPPLADKALSQKLRAHGCEPRATHKRDKDGRRLSVILFPVLEDAK